MNKPRVPITSRSFVYRDSAHTDIRKTFAAERKRLRQERKVVPITERRVK